MKSAPAIFVLLAMISTVVQAQAPAAAAVNSTIDLTVPMAEQPVADQAVFDESVSFAPNFAIDQKAPALSDLFGKDGSELCLPTSLAEALIFTQSYAQNRVDLPLAGLSADKRQIDPNVLVRDLAISCHTDLQTGTKPFDALNCMLDVQTKAGRGFGNSKMIYPFGTQANLPIEMRDVQIADIRAALKGGRPVILEAAWFDYDPATKTLKRNGGHYVGVYGYNYNRSWGEEQIQLKVVNPLTDYGPERKSKWSTITMARISQQPGIVYPPHRTYTLSGSAFGGLKDRALVGFLLVVAP